MGSHDPRQFGIWFCVRCKRTWHGSRILWVADPSDSAGVDVRRCGDPMCGGKVTPSALNSGTIALVEIPDAAPVRRTA